MAGRGRRRAVILLAVLGALLAGSVGLAAPASAHAQLVGSNPADGTTLQAAPRQLRIDLTQSVFPDKTTLRVTDSSGRQVPVGAPVVLVTGASPGDPGPVPRAGWQGLPTTILADLPPLQPDVYRVSWSTLSTDDLHTTSGVFVFGVQRAVAHQSGQVSDPLPPPGELVTRVLLLLAAAVAAGAGSVLVLLGADADALPGVRRRLLALAAAASGAAALLGVALLLVEADVLGAGLSFAANVLSSPAFLLRWAGREAAAVAAAVAFGFAWRRSRGDGVAATRTGPTVLGAGLPGLGVFAVTTALLGHTGSGSRALDVAAHAVHVTAALIWAGTVATAALVLAPRRLRSEALGGDGLRRRVLGRFGLVGLACLVAIVASGLVLVGAGSVSLDALILSTYGRLVLLKVAALLGAVTLAAVLTATLHPALVPARWRAGLRHRRWLLPAEALLLVAALALGATAAGARPAVGTEWTPTSAAPPLLSQQVEDLVETVKVGPNVPGRNFVTVDVFETRRPSPGPVTGVDVTIRGADGRSTVLPLKAQGSGTWLAASDAFDEPGAWSMTVVAHRDGLPDAGAGYGWLVADPSARLSAPMISSTPYQGLLDALAALAAAGGLALLAGLVIARRRRRNGPGPGGHPDPRTGAEAPPDPPRQRAVADGVGAR